MATIKRNVDVINVYIGSCDIVKNSSIFAMDVPAKIVNERTFIPLRTVSELLDCNVKWDASTYTVEINSKKLPFEVSYTEKTVTKNTRKEGVAIVVNYQYPVVLNGGDFLAEDAVVRANEIIEEVTFNMFDLNDYAFTFTEE